MESTFISGKPVEIEIGSPTKQGSNGRISLPLTMPLSDGNVKGMPDWLVEGFGAVSAHAKKFIPDVEEIVDIAVYFKREKTEGNMFPVPDAKISQAELKGFTILRVGDADEPDVALKFTLYAPFSREFWAWVGEMAGEKVYIGFPKTKGGAVAEGSSKAGTVEAHPAHAKEKNSIPRSPSMTEATGEAEPARTN